PEDTLGNVIVVIGMVELGSKGLDFTGLETIETAGTLIVLETGIGFETPAPEPV
ncbi:hypothetical protein A2U01_0113182, partial [Trifolium medium]|nr:hypothetical protein [Trifolium medium]